MNKDGLETIVNFLNQEVRQLLREQRTQTIAQTHLRSHQNLKGIKNIIYTVQTLCRRPAQFKTLN